MAAGQLLLTCPSRRTLMRPLSHSYLHAAVLGGITIHLTEALSRLVWRGSPR